MRSYRPRTAARTAALVLGLCACNGDSPAQPATAETSETSDATATSSDEVTGCTIGERGCPCTPGGGCDPDLVCDDEKKRCVEPDTSSEVTSAVTTAESTDSGDTSSTTALDETATDDSTSEGSETTAPPVECAKTDLVNFAPDCPNPARPFCGEDNLCTGCTDDAQCSGATAGQSPACGAAGACVQCDEVDAVGNGQCSDKNPHCNLDEFKCEGCLEHSECPGTACDIAARTCFKSDRMLYVRRGPTPGYPCTYEVPQGGSKSLPYCNMQPAIDHAQFNSASSGWIFTLMIADSNEEHSGFVVPAVDTPVSYAIKHEPGTPIDLHTRFVDYGPVITVNNRVTLYLIDMGVEQHEDSFADEHRGIDCTSGGSLWLDSSRVLRSVGPGIRAEGCDVHLRRSSIAFGRTEGIEMVGGSLQMENSFISRNSWRQGFGGGALFLSGGAAAKLVYTSLIDNANEKPNRGDNLFCDGPVSAEIRNSILGRSLNTTNPSVVCDGSQIKVQTSIVDGEFAADQGNQKWAPEDILKFVTLDTVTGAFRLKDPGMAAKVVKAVRLAGDPIDDFERQLRTPVEEDRDHAGADFFPSN